MHTRPPLSNCRFSLLILLFSMTFFRIAIAAEDECGNEVDTRIFFSPPQ